MQSPRRLQKSTGPTDATTPPRPGDADAVPSTGRLGTADRVLVADFDTQATATTRFKGSTSIEFRESGNGAS